MKEKVIFNVGDLVRHKDSVYEEGVVLLPSDDVLKRDHYYVVFCKGTSYEATPWLRLLHANKLVLVEKEIHKPRARSKFKK